MANRPTPGMIVLFGSGEIAPSSQPIYEHVMSAIESRDGEVRVAILETPAGFQLNSADVAGAIAEYLDHRLQNHKPRIEIVPARKRGTPLSPDSPEILKPLAWANMIFTGPGSPTYASRQLKDSLAWDIVQSQHRRGSALVLASAATIAVSRQAIPVYEIYKVGEEVHWQPGLDLFGPLGLSAVFWPHWNNNEGGEKHDTSRCFMGRPRYDQLVALLPAEQLIVGIDEHTALIVDSADPCCCRVLGRGSVSLVQGDDIRLFEAVSEFPLDELGQIRFPPPDEGIRGKALEMIRTAEKERSAALTPSDEVMSLANERTAARENRDWESSDCLRDEISKLGWEVRDTPDGQQLARNSS